MNATLTVSEIAQYIETIMDLVKSAKVNNAACLDNSIASVEACRELAMGNLSEAQVAIYSGNVSDYKAHLELAADMVYTLGNDLQYGFNHSYGKVGKMIYTAKAAL